MNPRYLRTDAREAAHIDSDLSRVLLFIETGEGDGTLIENTIFALTEKLTLVEDMAATRQYGEIAAAAAEISAKAGTIGLVLLSAVARDIEICARRADPVATAAVAARLVRIGSDSIFYLAQCMD